MVALVAWFTLVLDTILYNTNFVSSSFPPSGIRKKGGNGKETINCGWSGHMEKQETEIRWKLETETGNGNWKRKPETEKTEMETQPFHCCSPSKI